MSNKSITLDPRIAKGLASVISPMDVFSKAKADRFMRTVELVGYAADHLDAFSNLEGLTANLVRCVSVNPGALYPFECSLLMNPHGSVWHQFFIPESAVYRPRDDIPKARPFTIAEFRRQFEPPCTVYYRLKDACGTVYSPFIVGAVTAYQYVPGDDDSLEIVLSGMSTTLPLKARWLFDHVEWSPSGDLVDWRPFGTEGV